MPADAIEPAKTKWLGGPPLRREMPTHKEPPTAHKWAGGPLIHPLQRKVAPGPGRKPTEVEQRWRNRSMPNARVVLWEPARARPGPDAWMMSTTHDAYQGARFVSA